MFDDLKWQIFFNVISKWKNLQESHLNIKEVSHYIESLNYRWEDEEYLSTDFESSDPECG